MKVTEKTIQVGQAISAKGKSYAIYLAHRATGYVVTAGWAIGDSIGSDQDTPVAGLEHIPHAARNYDFGSDFEAAVAYYEHCKDAIINRRAAPKRLDRTHPQKSAQERAVAAGAAALGVAIGQCTATITEVKVGGKRETAWQVACGDRKVVLSYTAMTPFTVDA